MDLPNQITAIASADFAERSERDLANREKVGLLVDPDGRNIDEVRDRCFTGCCDPEPETEAFAAPSAILAHEVKRFRKKIAGNTPAPYRLVRAHRLNLP